MKTEELNFHLPLDRIAQEPACVRSASKLLVFNRQDKRITETRFYKIGRYLLAGDCLVLNNTKVLPARFFAQRASGGRLEGLFLAEQSPCLWEVLLKGAGRVKQDEEIYLQNKNGRTFIKVAVYKKSGGKCLLSLQTNKCAEDILDRIGFAPLPPYIKRNNNRLTAEKDKVRYQTVYAQHSGAVAAPTAGLHFTGGLINKLKDKGIKFACLTLHVGEGTFKPIDTENIEDFKIHPEEFSIDKQNAEIINDVRQKGGRVVAVGTTSARALETAAVESKIEAMSGSTELFIKPGYRFKAVDAMITNFHLPRSTLLAMVAAFAGPENVFSVYRYAIEKHYRFYSYGDVMLIL
jgi:S-adenosylmethionine:tRNA ribosyltransferase-isomerase